MKGTRPSAEINCNVDGFEPTRPHKLAHNLGNLICVGIIKRLFCKDFSALFSVFQTKTFVDQYFDHESS